MPTTIHFAITAHGLGHLTRTVAVIRALKELRPDLSIAVSTDLPEDRLRCELPFPFIFRKCAYEPGTAQYDCFRIDTAQTRAAYRSFFGERNRRIEEEEAFLRKTQCLGVVSDIPALAIRAAANLRLPSVGIANFTWDWILEPILDGHPEREILDVLRADYGAGQLHLQLPFGPRLSPFPLQETAPLVSRRARLSATEVRTRLALPQRANDERALVVVWWLGTGRLGMESPRNVSPTAPPSSPSSDRRFANRLYSLSS